MTEEFRQTTVSTMIKDGTHEWFLELSDKRKLGPYRNAAIALQGAAVEVWSARKRGLKADILVRDDYGYPHLCRLIDKCDGTERCVACQASWLAASHPVQPHCPLWKALGGL